MKHYSTILDSAPPHDHEAERALLGAIILSPEIVAELSDVRLPDFHDPINRAVYGCVRKLADSGKPADMRLLLSEVKATEAGDKAAALLAELSRSTTAANWKHYRDRVMEVSAKRRLRFLGERLVADSANGKSPSDAAEDAMRVLERVKAGTSIGGKVLTYRRLTCRELAAGDYAVEYLVQWMLVRGQPCIVSGPKKACKTTIVLDLAIALATGGYFLGRFKVNRACRVLVMTGESGLATVQETLRRIAAAAGWQLADIVNLIISDELPVLGQADHMAALKQMMQDDEIEVLIIDPAYLALPTDGNEGSLFAMGPLLRSINELCAQMGVTLILVHHTKKNISDPFAPPELEGIAWAGFQEFARQWLLLGRRERYEPGTGEHRLWLSAGGSAGHSSLHGIDIFEGAYDGESPREWRVDVLKASEVAQQSAEMQAIEKANKAETRRRAQLEEDCKALVRAMAKHPKGETKSILKDLSGLRTGRMDAAMAQLLQDGHAEPCVVERANGHKYDGYKPTNKPSLEE